MWNIVFLCHLDSESHTFSNVVGKVDGIPNVSKWLIYSLAVDPFGQMNPRPGRGIENPVRAEKRKSRGVFFANETDGAFASWR